jgi:pimeloyl-ACP methyl ester carboxylesterase
MSNDPLAGIFASATSPADIVAAVAADAEVVRTPCGEGEMIWRRWGRGRPVILAHGGSGSWTHWIKQIPVLKQRSEVWAVDLPGLGDSAMPPPPQTPEGCGQWLALGINSLFSRQNAPSLVCFSFGAHVSSFAAKKLGDRLRDLTFTGCAGLGLQQGTPRDYPREMEGMGEEERLAVHRELLGILMFKDKARIDDLAVHLQSENILRARFRSRPFARSDEIRRNLPEILVPLKAVWGGDDQTSWPSVEERLRIIGEFHPELVARIIPDAGHWAMYEQPAAYNAALIEVLGL